MRILRCSKPRLALAVGVTGHRSNRLAQDRRAAIADCIAFVIAAIAREAAGARTRYRKYFSGRAPALTLVSALAEGADTMAAKAALASRYELDVILPFARKEYEKDFAPDDAKIYRRLCGKAHSIRELDGVRTDEAQAYEAAGLAMLDASHILLAIWDGEPSAGRGGTVEIMNDAMARGIPVIQIDAQGLLSPKVVSREIDAKPAVALEKSLAVLIDARIREMHPGMSRDA